MPLPSNALPAGHVHVWWAPASGPPGPLFGLLCAEERSRNDRLRRPADRARFLAAHALARVALGGYLGIAPVDLRFDARCLRCGGPHGKPRLVGVRGELEFSLSHTAGRVGVAVARTHIGLDVEDLSVGVDRDAMHADVLSPAEMHDWAGIEEDQRPAALRRYWVRKESLLKATGEGLTIPLTRMTVSPPGEPACLIGWTGGPQLELVHLRDLRPGPGFLACLAALSVDPPQVTEFDGEALLSGNALLN